MKNKNKSFRADAIGSYFRLEWLPLLFVTLSGLVYNVGLRTTARPVSRRYSWRE